METITEKAIQDNSLTLMIDKIISRYHVYFKYNVPVISKILNSAIKFDKKAVKNLDLIYKHFEEFIELLEQHTSEEKYIIFPVLQKLDQEEKIDLTANELKNIYRKISKTIRKITSVLKQINDLTTNYKPILNASQSLKQCYWEMQKLEQNCYQYFEIEKKQVLPKLITKSSS